jgi:NADH dehydrogenase
MILLTGATGFVGGYVASRLRSEGRALRCLVRRTSQADRLRELGAELAYGDVTDPASLRQALAGVDTVIHLVAVIVEKGGATFDAVNHQGTVNLLEACQEAGVRRFLHMSNIGVGPQASFPFLRSKWQAEERVKASGLEYTIFRSSIMFGAGDEFINKLADIVRRAPIVPVIGSGRNLFQPIWVEDTARCVALALEREDTIGQVLPIGGPEHLSYEDIIDLIVETLGPKKPKLHIPLGLMLPLAGLMERVQAKPVVTAGQLSQLSLDNITDLDAVERVFGFKPASLREKIGYIR